MNANLKSTIRDAEWQVRVDLAACYRIVADYGWDDLIFTHISARVPGPERHFLLNYIFVAFLVTGFLVPVYFFQRWYDPLLRWALDHKVVFMMLPLCLVLFGGMVWLDGAGTALSQRNAHKVICV